ncbi:MAG TPA: hypothetical protein VKD71_11325, partial [Gemmataceae bacterium]|nr:hypothetical protein [Gemmataceae bacterium]
KNNRISRNSIFSNVGLGIDLNAANNANNLQTAPQLTSAARNSTGTAITVQGIFNSKPGTTYTIEFFASLPGDPEGKRFLVTKTVTTNSQGRASFTVTISLPIPLGDLITATATDPNGNTSEFSIAQIVN